MARSARVSKASNMALGTRLTRRQSGRRSRTKTERKRGRYIQARPANGKTSDIAFDATIRAAAPHQLERDRGKLAFALRKQDLQRKVRVKKQANLVLFVVDASWSMAVAERMQATKGAVMSLLTDAYQQRDRVGMVVFQKNDARVVLPPTNPGMPMYMDSPGFSVLTRGPRLKVLVPAALITMTSFTRILIVLAILRQALGTAQTPSNQILVGLALFLTLFIMSPVFSQAYADDIKPYFDETIEFRQASDYAAENLTGVYYVDFALDTGQSCGISDPGYLQKV